jgi:hypothetical protein
MAICGTSHSSLIVPELQQLVVGDSVPDSDDWPVFFTVDAVEPPHALVLHSTRHVLKPIQTIDFSWAFVIRELSPGMSRLLIRARMSYTPRRSLPFVELVIGRPTSSMPARCCPASKRESRSEVRRATSRHRSMCVRHQRRFARPSRRPYSDLSVVCRSRFRTKLWLSRRQGASPAAARDCESGVYVTGRDL